MDISLKYIFFTLLLFLNVSSHSLQYLSNFIDYEITLTLKDKDEVMNIVKGPTNDTLLSIGGTMELIEWNLKTKERKVLLNNFTTNRYLEKIISRDNITLIGLENGRVIVYYHNANKSEYLQIYNSGFVNQLAFLKNGSVISSGRGLNNHDKEIKYSI